ncbi:MAG TPA: IPT/TIG domain-containing protein [Thermoanaerobaculia bacterium]
MKKSLGFCLFLLSAPVLFAQTTVTAILPASGVTTGGDFVHIRGLRLNSSATAVKFGDALGRIVSNTYYEIVAIAPPHVAGSVDVSISITGAANPVVLTNAYRYQSRSNDEFERILLPVAASGPGPNAARFETEILITNAGDEPARVGRDATFWNSGVSPPPSPSVPAHSTLTLTDSLFAPELAVKGAFIDVPARMAHDVITKVRVHDTSRDAAAYGVEIPTVSDLDFAATVRLAGIPTDARFRSMLRGYAYDGRNFGPVTLRVRDAADGTLLATVPVAINAPLGEEDLFPAAAQLALDSIIAPLRSHARLRLDIADSDAVRPIWAFVSITNNQTQEITLVTPQASAVTPDKIPLGWWTANGNLIFVGEAESRVYLGCRFGTFKTPSSLDSDGRFKTTGTLSGPGPDIGGQPPLNFEGRVADGWLAVTIRSDSAVVTTTQFQFAGPQQPGPLPIACP